ncbi:hypothetical protein K461DRAFT_273248 [Myriangium duriaei CBS 260.36]|uniref:Uncharacterized protein n=1 Tax=Myriangium duriaei CBS 260.36 TaxID=1168546 RepID=A0A9P4JAK0_9PEZI|nr:hypothetical protein K461DRAFT_273248 [Myriangium duriaei CBS 260.36]
MRLTPKKGRMGMEPLERITFKATATERSARHEALWCAASAVGAILRRNTVFFGQSALQDQHRFGRQVGDQRYQADRVALMG